MRWRELRAIDEVVQVVVPQPVLAGLEALGNAVAAGGGVL